MSNSADQLIDETLRLLVTARQGLERAKSLVEGEFEVATAFLRESAWGERALDLSFDLGKAIEQLRNTILLLEGEGINPPAPPARQGDTK